MIIKNILKKILYTNCFKFFKYYFVFVASYINSIVSGIICVIGHWRINIGNDALILQPVGQMTYWVYYRAVTRCKDCVICYDQVVILRCECWELAWKHKIWFFVLLFKKRSYYINLQQKQCKWKNIHSSPNFDFISYDNISH